MTQYQRAFTLVELMVVIAVLGILALIALPSYQSRIIGQQVAEGVQGADFVRKAVSDFYALNKTLPVDNAAAGLPESRLIVGNYVSDVTVNNGATTITFGNRTNNQIKGQKLALRPAVVETAPAVPIAWVCGNAAVPQQMKAQGENTTTLPAAFLPLNCR
jgi:type IV pilus assembly protein PilA